jgi:hypothetical protein
MKKIIFLFVIIFFVWACEDNIQNPAITVTPGNLLQPADTGNIMQFNISGAAYTNHSLKTFKISYYTLTQLSKTILDSSLDGVSNFSYTFNFKIPDYTDTTEVFLLFYLVDNSGNTISATRGFLVQTYTASNTLLTEVAGNTIYTDPYVHKTAFNLLSCQPLGLGYSDSTQMDIMASLNKADSTTLTYTWVSPAKDKFVNFNGLDYANATEQSVQAAYNAGTKNDFISNIAVGNIYLTEIMSGGVPKFIVIRIMNIYNTPGSVDNGYIFNVKK